MAEPYRLPPGTKILREDELAAIFGVDRKSVWRWAETGHLASFRTIGGHRRFPIAANLAVLPKGFRRGPGLLSPGQVAGMCGVDPRAVSRWETAGRITGIRTPGGHRRFALAEVQKAQREGRIPRPADG